MNIFTIKVKVNLSQTTWSTSHGCDDGELVAHISKINLERSISTSTTVLLFELFVEGIASVEPPATVKASTPLEFPLFCSAKIGVGALVIRGCGGHQATPGERQDEREEFHGGNGGCVG